MISERITPITIVMQGRPIVSHDHGYLVRGNEEVVTLYVDLDSKYCAVSGNGSGPGDEGPIIFITETEYSQELGPPVEPECDTVIQFNEFPGWHVHAAEISKYTIAVALTKPIAF